MRIALENMSLASGEAFNVGGGPGNSTSLIELVRQIGELLGREVAVEWAPERLADQKWYVADTSKIEARLGWKPATTIASGLRSLRDWHLQRPGLVAHSFPHSVSESQVQVA